MAWENGIQISFFSFFFSLVKQNSISIFIVCLPLWQWKADLIFVFATLWKTHLNFILRFYLTLKKGVELRFSYFLFRLTLKSRFDFRFSFFVFTSLWKTDLNFLFRIHITLKNGFEFHFSFFISLHIASPPVSTRRLGNRLCLKLGQGHWDTCGGTWDVRRGTWRHAGTCGTGTLNTRIRGMWGR